MQILSIGRRSAVHAVREIGPGRYRGTYGPSYVEFQFDSTAGARFLALPGLRTDQDVVVSWREGSEPWRPAKSVRWLRSGRSDLPVVIDLERLIHWSGKPVTGVRIAFTRPGELAVSESPRLLR